MLYSFLKILVRRALKIFFKRIYVSGLENIKMDRPQLIASNHPSGFMEPLIMACFFPKSLHFLVRGDVFDKKWLRPLLKNTNQIPIFRYKDGFSRLRENAQNMDESSSVLLENKNLLIFVEGSTQSIKKLRPLQKGIARIGFQALEKNPDLNLEILPVGINFTFTSLFNDEVMLKIGKPISVKAYLTEYHKDKNQATEKLLFDTYKLMLPHVVHIDDQSQIPTFEELVLLTRKEVLIEQVHPVYVEDDKRLNKEIGLANTINTLDTATKRSLIEQVRKLNQKFDNKIDLKRDLLKTPLNLSRFILLTLGFIPAMAGLLLHCLPIIGGWIFTKAKVKQREFKSTLLFVVTLVFILIMYLFWIPLILKMQWPWWTLFAGIALGLWARYYHRIWTSTLFKKSKEVQEFSKALDNIYQTYLPSM